MRNIWFAVLMTAAILLILIAPQQANAGVRVGIGVGVVAAPVYTYPACAPYPCVYPYPYPCVYPYPYYYPYPYGYVAPAYIYPYGGVFFRGFVGGRRAVVRGPVVVRGRAFHGVRRR
jgi:hypothetical protein